jgi:hypothetical protein
MSPELKKAIVLAVRQHNKTRVFKKKNAVLRKKALRQLKKTIKQVKATKTIKKPLKKATRSAKQEPKGNEDLKLYRRILRSITKKGKAQSEKVWRSVDHYHLKSGEEWVNDWAYDHRKPTASTPTFVFPLFEM